MRLRFLDDAPPPPFEFAVDGLIPRRGLTILAGAPEAGKSMLAAELAVATVLGGIWAGREIAPSGSVLYVAPERGATQERRIRSHMGFDPRVAIAPDAFDLREVGAVGDLHDAVRRVQERSGEPIGLVVVDTFAAAAPGIRENETAEVEPIASALRRLSETIGAPVILVHHTGKDGTLRGTTALPAAADAVLMVKAGTKGARRLVHDMFKEGQKASDVLFSIEGHDGSPRVIWLGQSDRNAAQADDDTRALPRLSPNERIILDAIESLRKANPKATSVDLRNTVFEALGNRSIGAKYTALSDGRKSLISKGYIASDDPILSLSKNANPKVAKAAKVADLSTHLSNPPSLRRGAKALRSPKPRPIAKAAAR